MSSRRRQRVSSASALMVEDYIRQSIQGRSLKPGERLPAERDLVKQMGVSRTSVRAGLQALASKGVLVIKHGSGTFVAEGPLVLDSRHFHFLSAMHGYSRTEMFQARRVLEGGAAALAAEEASGDDLATISDAVTGMFASTSDSLAFLAYDAQFHRAVAAASHNPILASIVEMVAGMFFETRRSTVLQGRDLQPVAEIHRLIYQAIRVHDAGLAQNRMIQHLLDAERLQEWQGGSPRIPASTGAPPRVHTAEMTQPPQVLSEAAEES
jgi:GntR family transcriptional repressor for pyruvate dehydrogenase complex